MFQFCVVLVTERRLSYVHLHISQMRAFSAWLAVHKQSSHRDRCGRASRSKNFRSEPVHQKHQKIPGTA